MKTLKNTLWVVCVSLSVVVFNACSKEEVVIPKAIVDDTNSGNGNQQSGENGEITLYTVSNGEITKVTDYKVTGEDLAFQKDVAKHKEIWALTRKIVPLDQLKKMTEFMIYNGSKSGSAGYVVERNKDLSEWQMGIAINYAYQGGFNAGGELAYTIIHEFGHILTLNDTQLDSSIDQGNCNNYYPGEGCAKQNAYINELYQNYWKDVWNEFQTAQNNQSSQERFYNKYKDRFVTNYASTNPGEDIAEVFATFVTRKDKPSGSNIAEKKILLMHKRSELVAFRNHIRKNLQLRGRGSNTGFILPEPGAWKQAKTFGNPFKTKCRRH